ncbi:hypothetical protein AJ80_01780 [Polytolypa hystricis UAMH7299]|uniref:Uncharacterized protein n=1 Tax=Polytolypa hystricis (strain UAMH7299) TaxID=1447883 RepID=A0A2B7Z0W7_POLH7|nr:hypothetical protein AJ80_01780 [Polytolypa hystricis UAMH7299]
MANMGDKVSKFVVWGAASQENVSDAAEDTSSAHLPDMAKVAEIAEMEDDRMPESLKSDGLDNHEQMCGSDGASQNGIGAEQEFPEFNDLSDPEDINGNDMEVEIEHDSIKDVYEPGDVDMSETNNTRSSAGGEDDPTQNAFHSEDVENYGNTDIEAKDGRPNEVHEPSDADMSLGISSSNAGPDGGSDPVEDGLKIEGPGDQEEADKHTMTNGMDDVAQAVPESSALGEPEGMDTVERKMWTENNPTATAPKKSRKGKAKVLSGTKAAGEVEKKRGTVTSNKKGKIPGNAGGTRIGRSAKKDQEDMERIKQGMYPKSRKTHPIAEETRDELVKYFKEAPARVKMEFAKVIESSIKTSGRYMHCDGSGLPVIDFTRLPKMAVRDLILYLKIKGIIRHGGGVEEGLRYKELVNKVANENQEKKAIAECK